MKQLIFFALAVICFAVSILYSSQFLDIQPLIIMFSFGGLTTSFLYRAGLNKRDFDERKYKKLLREKNNLIKGLQIILCVNNEIDTKPTTQDILDKLQRDLSPEDINLPNDLRL